MENLQNLFQEALWVLTILMNIIIIIIVINQPYKRLILIFLYFITVVFLMIWGQQFRDRVLQCQPFCEIPHHHKHKVGMLFSLNCVHYIMQLTWVIQATECFPLTKGWVECSRCKRVVVGKWIVLVSMLASVELYWAEDDRFICLPTSHITGLQKLLT